MGDQSVQCPNRGCCAHQPSAFPSGTSVPMVAGCCKTSGDVVWSGLVRCYDVTSGQIGCDVVTSVEMLRPYYKYYKIEHDTTNDCFVEGSLEV